MAAAVPENPAGIDIILHQLVLTVIGGPTVTLGEATGISMSAYMWDTRLGIGWVAGLANPTGVVLMVILTIIVAFSHRIVRKSGYFEVGMASRRMSLSFIKLNYM